MSLRRGGRYYVTREKGEEIMSPEKREDNDTREKEGIYYVTRERGRDYVTRERWEK